MKKKVSLKDIAKEVGVSIATVSYVLSKRKNSRVSDQMTERIEQVAKKLNYQPNQIAKSLRSGKTYTIGLIVADVSNPFFANIARIIEDEASKFNYNVIFGSSDEKAEKSLHLIQFLSNRQVDGFIIAPSEGSESQIKDLKEQHIPFVLIDRCFPEIPTNYVIIDNFKASYNAVNRLISTGNKKIGMIAYANTLYHMKERIRGFKTAMEENGVSVASEWLKTINFSNMKTEVETAIDSLLSGENSVESIFFATNTLAIHGLKYINELNLKVPDNVTIVSFDQGEAFDFYYCPLTYVKQPLVALGENAVRILVEQIANPEIKEQKKYLNAELVVRESCSRV